MDFEPGTAPRGELVWGQQQEAAELSLLPAGSGACIESVLYSLSSSAESNYL